MTKKSNEKLDGIVLQLKQLSKHQLKALEEHIEATSPKEWQKRESLGVPIERKESTSVEQLGYLLMQ